MLPLASIAIATILVAVAASASSKPRSTEAEVRSEILKNGDAVHYEDAEREKREAEASPREPEAPNPLRRESSSEELAAAVGFQNVGYEDTGNYVTEDPRQAGGWRDAVPGTPGMDYPNLDRIPVTSFTCTDKEPGGYYADVETGCQVFHVCNTGGVKSSFLCPPGSIFNQKHFVCDWWYGFNCQEAEDLYFKRPEANFPDPEEEIIDRVIENPETTTPVAEALHSSPEKRLRHSRVQNDQANDRSFTSGGRRIIDHSSRERYGQIDEDSHDMINVHDYPADSRSHEDLHNDPGIDHRPRGFSRNDEKSFERRKFDAEENPRDSSNDLASYVNHAYFQAGFSDHVDHNDPDDDDDLRTNFDRTKLEEEPKNQRQFGHKFLYAEEAGHEYSEMVDGRRIESFKSIDEYV